MGTSGGWAIVAGTLIPFGIALFLLRRNLSGSAAAIAAAAAGAGVGIGGLVVVGDVGVWSWIVAPVVLAVATALQLKALSAPGGPFRT
jgi:hypothetical protein